MAPSICGDFRFYFSWELGVRARRLGQNPPQNGVSKGCRGNGNGQTRNSVLWTSTKLGVDVGLGVEVGPGKCLIVARGPHVTGL
ncbi:hypothetical protein KFK09_005686 [Dendrobium nobile]|uniref:Uncharacterized protein n=1 Tax=Dendrobium nobile TaxID=94219 RepID=A0A8T3BZ12_DENNO|nr:hypothetical protein KFK09_005686 [Dendrobium nobile]